MLLFDPALSKRDAQNDAVARIEQAIEAIAPNPGIFAKVSSSRSGVFVILYFRDPMGYLTARRFKADKSANQIPSDTLRAKYLEILSLHQKMLAQQDQQAQQRQHLLAENERLRAALLAAGVDPAKADPAFTVVVRGGAIHIAIKTGDASLTKVIQSLIQKVAA
jgi:hypothetical protein